MRRDTGRNCRTAELFGSTGILLRTYVAKNSPPTENCQRPPNLKVASLKSESSPPKMEEPIEGMAPPPWSNTAARNKKNKKKKKKKVPKNAPKPGDPGYLSPTQLRNARKRRAKQRRMLRSCREGMAASKTVQSGARRTHHSELLEHQMTTRR